MKMFKLVKGNASLRGCMDHIYRHFCTINFYFLEFDIYVKTKHDKINYMTFKRVGTEMIISCPPSETIKLDGTKE